MPIIQITKFSVKEKTIFKYIFSNYYIKIKLNLFLFKKNTAILVCYECIRIICIYSVNYWLKLILIGVWDLLALFIVLIVPQ